MNIADLVSRQRAYFRTGATRSPAVRTLMLDRLYRKIREMEPEINDALEKDLGKSAFETFMCETGLTLSEISYMKKHLEKFSARKRVKTPLAQFPSRSYILKEPYGVTLIMSPWNYPFLLSLEPLVDAVAAGNTVVLKPSAYSPHTSAVIKKLIAAVFPEEYVSVVEGAGRPTRTFWSRNLTISSSPAAPRWAGWCWRRRRRISPPSPWRWAAKAPASWTRPPT